MNVNQLISKVFKNMNENSDSNSYLEFRDEILGYINDAYFQVMISKLKPIRFKTIEVCESKIELAKIDTNLLEIIKIYDKNNKNIQYYTDEMHLVIDNGIYDITYTFCPDLLCHDEDIPMFNSGYHSILSDYATYRMYLKGSPQRQKRGDAFISSYYNGLHQLESKKTNLIANKWC